MDDEVAEKMMTKASELPPKVEMNVVVGSDRKIQLDEDQMEKLDLESEDLVRVIVEKIPDE